MSIVTIASNTDAPPAMTVYLDSRQANYSTSRKFYDPESQALSGENDFYHSDSEWYFASPITVPPGFSTMIACTSCSIPVSYYQITPGINDMVYMRLTVGEVHHDTRAVIPPGNYYDYDKFATVLQTAINDTLTAVVPGMSAVSVKYIARVHRLMFGLGSLPPGPPPPPPPPPPSGDFEITVDGPSTWPVDVFDTYTYNVTHTGTPVLPLTYIYAYGSLDKEGNPNVLWKKNVLPSGGAEDETSISFEVNQYYPLGFVSFFVSVTVTDSNDNMQTVNKIIPIDFSLSADTDVKLTFLAQGVPYDAKGTGQSTATTQDRGVFTEVGLRRDRETWMSRTATGFTSQPAAQTIDGEYGCLAPHAIDLNSTKHTIYVRCDLISGGSMSSMEEDGAVDDSNIIASIGTGGFKAGDLIQEVKGTLQHPIRFQMNSLTSIRLVLVDARNTLLDLNGCDWQCAVTFAWVPYATALVPQPAPGEITRGQPPPPMQKTLSKSKRKRKKKKKKQKNGS